MHRPSKRLSVLIAISVLLGTFSFSYTVLGDSISVENGLSYVRQEMNMIIADDPDCPWTGQTAVAETLVLYDPDGNENGYIFNYQAGYGFMQISFADDAYYLISYGYQAPSSVSKLLKDENIDPKEQHIIYNGSLSYLVDQNGIYTDLYSKKQVQFTKQQAKADYKVFKAQMKTEKANSKKNAVMPSVQMLGGIGIPGGTPYAATVTSTYVTGADYNFLCDNDDFKGKQINGVTVDGFCVDTSATNIVKYWAQKRGVSALYYSSDWWVFSSLYVNMKTNPSTGTQPNAILPGFQTYSRSTRGVSYVDCDSVNGAGGGLSFGLAKQIIDTQTPFLLSVYGYQNIGRNHTMSCFGYANYSDGTQSLIFNDTNSKTWTFQWIGSLVLIQFDWIKWK